MSVSLTVMTFNLHEDQAEDSPNSWEKRKDLCISVITNYSPMILCTQQGLLLLSLHVCLCVVLFLVVFSVDRMFWYLSFLLGTWVFVLLSSSWVMCVYIYIYGLYCGGFFDLGFLCLLHLVDLIVFQLEFEWLPIGISYCSFLPFILCMDLGVKTQLDYLQQCLPGNFSLMV